MKISFTPIGIIHRSASDAIDRENCLCLRLAAGDSQNCERLAAFSQLQQSDARVRHKTPSSQWYEVCCF